MDSPSGSLKTKRKPNLRGAQETLLGVLYSKALDARAAKSVLSDPHAAHIVDGLDYDFTKMRISPGRASYFALRSRYFDRWTAEFLNESHGQEEVTVLHLACGLDTRSHRLQEICGPNVLWVDVDLPDVVELRQQLVPAPARMAGRGNGERGEYQLVGADVTDELWLAKLQLPRDRRTIVMFEGLSMYLKPEQGRALIEQLTSYFTGERNQMVFDCLSWFPVWLQWVEPIIANTTARWSWGIGDPRELEAWHEGLRLRDEESAIVSAVHYADEANLGVFWVWLYSFFLRVPLVRNIIRYLRFEWSGDTRL